MIEQKARASFALECDISIFLWNCPHGLLPLRANEHAVWHRNANYLATGAAKKSAGSVEPHRGSDSVTFRSLILPVLAIVGIGRHQGAEAEPLIRVSTIRG